MSMAEQVGQVGQVGQEAHDAGAEVTLVTGRVVKVREGPQEVVHRVGAARKDAEEGLIDLTREDGSLITVAAACVVCIEAVRGAPGVIPFPARHT